MEQRELLLLKKSFRTFLLALVAAVAICGAAAAGDDPFFINVDFSVTNFGWEKLADGAQVQVRVLRPVVRPAPFPAVIIVPPLDRAALAAKSDRWSKSVAREMDLAELCAQNGVAAVLFNPPGQGNGDFKSTGPDGRGGYMAQDALGQVILAVAAMDFIDKDNIGIYSEGDGLSMAAGALARNSEIKVRWLIDADGPWDNLEMSGVPWDKITSEAPREKLTRAEVYFQHKPTTEDASPENVDWWRRREPKVFASSLRVKYYQRVQFEYDRAQPPGYFAHALRMYEAVRLSQVPHLRFNHQPWDAELPLSRVPQPVPGRLDDVYPDGPGKWIIEQARMADDLPDRVIPEAPAPDPSALPHPFSLY